MTIPKADAIGVNLQTNKYKDKTYKYWACHWYEGGRSKHKLFSVLKLGNDKAYEEAVIFRSMKEVELAHRIVTIVKCKADCIYDCTESECYHRGEHEESTTCIRQDCCDCVVVEKLIL